MNLQKELDNFDLNLIDNPIPFDTDQAVENVLNNLERAGALDFNVWVSSNSTDAFINEDALNNLTTSSNYFSRFENVNPKRSS